MSAVPAKIVAAIGAWASLIVYALLTNGFLDKVRALQDGAADAPKLDAGLTSLAALFGTAVVGVIAGLAGVSIAQAGIMSMPKRLGQFLVVKPGWLKIGKIATAVYLLVYFGLALLALMVWADHGSDLTPDFVRAQVLAAAGLIAAMAALNAST